MVILLKGLIVIWSLAQVNNKKHVFSNDDLLLTHIIYMQSILISNNVFYLNQTHAINVRPMHSVKSTMILGRQCVGVLKE